MRIRVTRLTERFVAFEYAHCFDHEQYYIPPSDELFQQLFFTSNTETSKTLATEGATFIDIDVKAHFAALIQPDTVGLRLHRYVKKEMCRDVELMLASEKEDKTKIREVINYWLKSRHIEDEDFSLETAVKTFFRFRQEKAKKWLRNTAKYCAPFVPFSRNIMTKETQAELEQILRGYIAANEPYFLTTKKKPHKRRIKQCRCFILRKIGFMTTRMISQKTSTPIRTVQHAIRRFDLFLKSKPNLKFPTF